MTLTRRNMRGVTLVELMIVVVIVSILVAIGYPSYLQFTARAKRTEAKAALLKIAVNQERIYLQNNTFTTDLLVLGFSSTPAFVTDSGSYIITITNADAADYSATATFQMGGAEAAKCNIFSIDGRGVKASSPDTDCWTRNR